MIVKTSARIFVMLFAALALVVGVSFYFGYQFAATNLSHQAPTQQWQPAAPTLSVPSVMAPIETCTVQVLAPAAKKKLRITAPARTEVVSATTAAPSERPITTATLIDTITGETSTITRAEAFPFFAVDTRTRIGIYAWQDNLGRKPTAAIIAEQALFNVHALQCGGVALLTARHQGIGVGCAYRF